MDPFDCTVGHNDVNMLDCSKSSAQVSSEFKQMRQEERKTAAHQEMRRMQQLPANSSYAIHRLRVLNKILHLMSIQGIEDKSDFGERQQYIWLPFNFLTAPPIIWNLLWKLKCILYTQLIMIRIKKNLQICGYRSKKKKRRK